MTELKNDIFPVQFCQKRVLQAEGIIKGLLHKDSEKRFNANDLLESEEYKTFRKKMKDRKCLSKINCDS